MCEIEIEIEREREREREMESRTHARVFKAASQQHGCVRVCVL